MSQKTFIGLIPNFNGMQSGQTIVYSGGNWTGATIYTATEIDNNFLSANTFDTTINTNGINNTGNITATTFYGDLDWSYITSTPTTLSGYGITDAYTMTETDNNFLSANTSFYTQAEADGKFVYKTGDTMTGELIINKTGQQALTVYGNANITGNFYVSGTTTYVNVTNMNVADNIITINSGETGGGVTKGSAGIRVDRGTENDYFFLFDELRDEFVIGMGSGETAGDISLLQSVATREDNPTNSGIAYWNNSERRFDTSTALTFNGGLLNLDGDLDATGNITANTFYGAFAGTITTDNLSLTNLTATTAWITTNNSTTLNTTSITYAGQNIDDVFVNVNGDTMTGNLTVPTLSATTVSATTLEGDLDWLYITNKPTTISGYGITDAYTMTETDNNFLSANTSFYTQAAADAKFVYKTGDTMTGELITPKVSATTLSATTTYSEDIFVTDDLDVAGDTTLNTLALQSGVTVYGISDATGLTENSNSYLPTQAAVKAYVDAQIAVENYWDATGTVLSPETGYDSLNIPSAVTALTFYGNLDWSYIQNEPTTLAGYGIYDAYTTGQTNAYFLSANTAYYLSFSADTGSISANIPADGFTFTGGASITTSITGDVLTIAVDEGNFLSANTSFYTEAEADAKFVFKTGDTMTGTLIAPILSATTVSATTLEGNLDWSYIQNEPNFDGLYYSISGGTIYGGINATGYNVTASTFFGNVVGSNGNFTNLTGDTFNSTTGTIGSLDVPTSLEYRGQELEDMFVHVTGDTMTGELIINRTGQQALTVSGNVNMTGDLYVSGTTTYINTEDMNVKDNLITINSGETGAGVSKLFAGIRVDRGSLDDYVFLFDEMQDNFRIGMSNAPTGGTQAVATREDNPISYGIAYWNSSQYRFDTSTNLVYSGSTLWLSNDANITGNVTGNTFYGTFVGTVSTTNLSLSNLTATTSWLTTSNITNANITNATATTFNSTNGTITNLSATTINYNGQDINDVFVNVNGDTMTGTLTVPTLTATTVSATTLYGDLDWSYIQNEPNFDGLYYSISGGTIYGGINATGYNVTASTFYGNSVGTNANFTNVTGTTTYATSIYTTSVNATGNITASTVYADLSGDVTASTLYYNGQELEDRFVHVTGDTMTGTLTMTGATANILVDGGYIEVKTPNDGIILTSTLGVRYRITVDENGYLVSTPA